MERETDRQTIDREKQTYRQSDRQTEIQTDQTEIDRQTDRQRVSHSHHLSMLRIKLFLKACSKFTFAFVNLTLLKS